MERKSGVELGDIGMFLSAMIQMVVIVGGVGFLAFGVIWWFIQAIAGLF